LIKKELRRQARDWRQNQDQQKFAKNSCEKAARKELAALKQLFSLTLFLVIFLIPHQVRDKLQFLMVDLALWLRSEAGASERWISCSNFPLLFEGGGWYHLIRVDLEIKKMLSISRYVEKISA